MKNKFSINPFVVSMFACLAIIVAVTGCSEDEPEVIPPAEIISLSVSEGTPGTAITITGKYFSAVTAENKVFFGDIEAEVTGGTTTSLVTTVPLGASTGPVSVQVGTAAKVEGPVFTIKENLVTVHLKHVEDDAEEFNFIFP